MLETALQTALDALVGGRCWPDVAPAGTARPYITWQQVGGEAPTYVDDTTPDQRNARVQINVWADRRLDAAALALSVEPALIAALSARPVGAPVATHDPDTGLRGMRQDFTIWAGR